MKRRISSLNLPKAITKELEYSGFQYVSEAVPEIPELAELCKGPVRQTALEILQEEFPIVTGIGAGQYLDFVAKNLIPGTITELTGLPGSGKTQLCMKLSVQAQLDGGTTIYVSTNKSFALQRYREIGKGLKDFSNGLYVEASTVEELSMFIQTVPTDSNLKLIVLDSVTFPLKQVNSTERMNCIYKILRDLQSLGNKAGFAILITNDLTTKVNGATTYIIPALGESFYHCVNTRIFLAKEKQNTNGFTAKILKGTFLEDMTSFEI